MGIAITLQRYLAANGVTYDSLVRDLTGTSMGSAESSHIPSERLAKAVVLKRREGYIVAVLPASRQLEVNEVGGLLDQPVAMATETEVAGLFPDCEPGAVPPIAAAYGLKSFVDESLEAQPDVFFEAGDHRTLVHVSGTEFHKLMENVPHGNFSKVAQFKSANPASVALGDELWKYDVG